MKLKLILTTAIAGMAVALLAVVTPAQAAPFAYVTNPATDSVSQFNVGAGGLLAPLSPATVATGGEPHRAAVSPNGRSLYVTNSSSDSLSGFVSQYDVGPGGALSPKTPAAVAVGPFPFGVAVSPDGRSAYVASWVPPSVSQYDVGRAGRSLPRPLPPLSPAPSRTG